MELRESNTPSRHQKVILEGVLGPLDHPSIVSLISPTGALNRILFFQGATESYFWTSFHCLLFGIVGFCWQSFC